VQSATGCAWTATANAAWLTITAMRATADPAPSRLRWRRTRGALGTVR
jgi:hypothetical protein